MSSETHRAVKLQDICATVCDGDWIETKDQGGSDYRLLQISNVGTGNFVETGKFRWITQETFAALRCSEILQGDILIARMPEPTGRCWWVNQLPWRAVTAVDVTIARPLPQVVDGRYLAYYINSPSTLAAISGLTTGTTRMRVRRADLANLDLLIPLLPEQKAIAHILGTLDEKIELNRKTNETLEAMARALFKSWFVDFDPVRAKAESRSTGLPAEISDLFPDSFEDSELGEIPSGWNFDTLGNISDWMSGTTPSKGNPEYWGGSIPWISANTMKDLFAINSDLNLTQEGVSSGARIAREGSLLLLVRGSGLHSRISMCFAATNMAFNQDVKSITAKRCQRMTTNHIFAYLSAISEDLLNMVEFTGIGAGKLDTDRLKSLPIAISSKQVFDAAENLVNPIYNKIKGNLLDSVNLAGLRDNLLPKLISGEIRIPDAENMLEEVGV